MAAKIATRSKDRAAADGAGNFGVFDARTGERVYHGQGLSESEATRLASSLLRKARVKPLSYFPRNK